MTYVIVAPCIDAKHKDCIDVCPVDCIHLESDELDRMLYINPDECIDCGACEPACPVAGIFPDGSVPAEWEEFVALNRDWYADPAPVRRRLDQLYPVAG